MSKFVLAGLAGFAVVGFMFTCTVIACYAGFSEACVVDLMPAGGDIMCTKQKVTK